jgi:hypothetical protein
MWVAHVHITRANVTCVLEVCWWTDHGPVNPPHLLPHTFPLHTQISKCIHCEMTSIHSCEC